MAGINENFKDHFSGANGFEELRRYIKQGSDFTKEAYSILHERAELELTYAKGLQKLATKLQKCSKDILGSTAYVWQVAAVALENEAELHKNLSLGLTEDITKQLKSTVESQHKKRKSIESVVDKAHKVLCERRSEEQKYKKQSFVSTKENEKLQDQTSDARSQKGTKIISDKDLTKLEQKRRKAEENVHKTDQDYFISCLKAERARIDWEVSVVRANEQFQQLEEDRLLLLQDYVQKYCNHISVIGPKMIEDYGRLTEAIATLDSRADLMTVIDARGTVPNASEQILPDFYAEELGNSMKKERRREILEKYLNMTKQRLDQHTKEVQGVRTLSRGVNSSVNFTDADNNTHINNEIQKMHILQNYLEVFQYKVQCAIADLETRSRPTHPLSVHLVKQRDKQGMSQVILKIPPWVRANHANGEISPCAPSLEQAYVDNPDGVGSNWVHGQTHRRNLSADQIHMNRSFQEGGLNTIGRCRALYVFEGNTNDELSIHPGDIITLYSKEDEWWHGELNERVGFFPATYVEEI